MIRRNKALQKTADKYRGKAFKWGTADCIVVLRSHLVAANHKNLPKLPKYRDALSAKRALKMAGFDSLEALLDSLLPRITPAAMLPGDVALMQGEGPLDAVTICVGRKVAGWFEGEDRFVMITPHQIKAAWRI